MLDDCLQQFVRHLARLPFVVRARFIEQLIQCGAVERLNHLNLVMTVGRNEEPRRSGVRLKDLRKLNRLDRLHVRTEVLEQVFDPVTERGRRTRATRASAAHVKINDAVAETRERDVATILSDRRPHARLEQLLDRRDRRLVFGIVTTGGRCRLNPLRP